MCLLGSSARSKGNYAKPLHVRSRKILDGPGKVSQTPTARAPQVQDTMGLGGRREKQVIGADPRNTKWANDTSNPGHRLLSSMGWKADGAATENEKRSGLMAHASTKRLRVIPVPKAGMEGIGYRPNAAAAASVSLALPGSGGGGTGSRASTASSIFARMGSKAALQFVSAGATKEVINKAKTEGGEFQGLLARLNAASASASPAPSSADEDATPVKGEAAPAVEEGSAGDDDEEEAAPAGETKAERKERRRRKKLGKEEKRAAKRARKAAKNGAPVEVVLLPTPAPSDDGQQAVAVVPAVAESPIVPLQPMAFNPRMA
jgi:hypothetical protein